MDDIERIVSGWSHPPPLGLPELGELPRKAYREHSHSLLEREREVW